MLAELSYYRIEIFFGFTIILALIWFMLACRSLVFMIFSLAWVLLQVVLVFQGFYLNFNVFPPRMVYGVIPPILSVVMLFLFPWGRKFILSINLKTITFFHTIRIPVEIVLWMLAAKGFVSGLQTFEGLNFDIISGLSAPIVGYLVFYKKNLGRKFLLGWNIFALILLFNIVIVSGLALPSPHQILAINKPNIAVAYFPFNMLPTVVVPLIFTAHFAAIWRLWKGEKTDGVPETGSSEG